MSEVTLWNWLRPYLPQGHYSRVETPDTCPGHPDVTYTVITQRSRTGFIELKDNPRSATVPFPDEEKGLHLSQRVWIKNCMNNGGTVWIVAGLKKQVLWIIGDYQEYFNGRTREELMDIASHVMDKTKVTKEDLKIIRELL